MKRRLRFSKTRLDRLKPESTRFDVFDEGDPKSESGLCLRVTPTGIKTFALYKWFNGKPIRSTIGRFPDVTVEQARKKAAQIKAEMLLNDVNPSDAKKAKRSKGITLMGAYADFVQGRKLAANSVRDYETALRLYLKDWQDKPLKEITREMVISWYAKSCKQSESSASKAARLLRAVFNHAADHYTDEKGDRLFTDNPVKELSSKKAWSKEHPRDNRIAERDFKSWFQAADKQSPLMRDYLVFVLLTSLRRREASTLKWNQINFIERTLTITSTKNGDPLTLPLSDYLIAMLERRQAETGSTWVFHSPDSTSGHVEEPKKATQSIYEISGVKATVHDLRRTFSSVAADVGVSDHAIKAFMNHRQRSDVTKTHYRSLEIERLRISMQQVTDVILNAGDVVKKSEVITPVIQAWSEK